MNPCLSLPFCLLLLSSCHLLHGSDLGLRFLQPALARSLSASSSPLPLQRSREETRPAFSTPALGGAAALGPDGIPHPEP